MKATSLSCACMEAQLEMADFMLEYSSRKSSVFFFDGLAGATREKVIGEVVTLRHSDTYAVPLDYLDGDEEEDFFLQYGANDPIPASVLPQAVKEYIGQIVK